jgi:hypothetical protein
MPWSNQILFSTLSTNNVPGGLTGVTLSAGSTASGLTTLPLSDQVHWSNTIIVGGSAMEVTLAGNTAMGVTLAGNTTVVTWSATTSPASRLSGTEEKIRSFSTLPAGWHYGGGRAASPEMIATAIQWHRHLIGLGFTVTDAFPGAKGEIMVTAYEGAHYVELLLDTISTVSLIHERDGKEVRSLERVTPDQAFRALGELAGEIWNTSDYSIESISTVNAVSLRASPSRSMMTERPLSGWPVSLESASASIYKDTIQASGAILLYSGFLTKPSYPRIAA